MLRNSPFFRALVSVLLSFPISEWACIRLPCSVLGTVRFLAAGGFCGTLNDLPQLHCSHPTTESSHRSWWKADLGLSPTRGSALPVPIDTSLHLKRSTFSTKVTQANGKQRNLQESEMNSVRRMFQALQKSYLLSAQRDKKITLHSGCH